MKKDTLPTQALTGTIIHLRHSLGWGLILMVREGKEDKVYFNGSDIEDRNVFRSLAVGQKVSFVLTASKRGPRAISVVVLDSSQVA